MLPEVESLRVQSLWLLKKALQSKEEPDWMSNASSGLCINLGIYIILYYAGPLFRILGCNEVGMPPITVDI